jgi:presenilin-like A22 family membrane protease
MITLYLQTLFTWKTSLVFAAFITAADIVLVLITKAMVSVARATLSLQLPVLVTVPTIPRLPIPAMSLGLGDFFFAGLLAIQSFKKYGRRFGAISMIAMTASFMIFEAFLLTDKVNAFPGTVMIITGWLPLIIWKHYKP